MQEEIIQNLVYSVMEEGQYAWSNYGSDIPNIEDAELRTKAEKARKLADEFEKAHYDFLNAASTKGYDA